MGFLTKFIPNFFVIGFSLFLFISSIFHCLPMAFSRHSNQKFILIIITILIISFYFMFIWCWLYAACTDAGSVEYDLKDKGEYNNVKQGLIPPCISGLRICPICLLPQPYGCIHCHKCKKCHLRQDHHCGVIGNCVADKNFKAFILSFIYASLFGFSLAFGGLFCVFDKNQDIINLLVTLYGGILGIILFIFGVSFFVGGFDYMSYRTPISKKIAFRRLLRTFGDTWFEKILPIQKHISEYAWPGVDWDTKETPLL